ncbi:MAG: hypothetical protein V1874_08835 [Spirochaetota bacterium]
MSNGINNISTFEKLLLRFRFKQFLPNDVKVFIVRYEQKALIKTLQNFGEYNLIYGLAVRIFFLSYKLKLRFSIKQSKIILGIISIITAGILTAAILFSAEYIKNNNSELSDKSDSQILVDFSAEQDNSKHLKDIIKDENKAIQEKSILSDNKNVKYRLGVNLFSAKNIESSLSKTVTDNIHNELLRTLGQGKVIDLSKNQKGLRFNRILSGSVSGLGKKIIITAKVIDVGDSKVIFGVTETIDSANEIDVKCTGIAETILKEIEWK